MTTLTKDEFRQLKKMEKKPVKIQDPQIDTLDEPEEKYFSPAVTSFGIDIVDLEAFREEWRKKGEREA